jgi:hypothetical protein
LLSPRFLFPRAAPTGSPSALGVHNAAAVLQRAGYRDIEVFNLLPNLADPRTLASVAPDASRRAFGLELRATHASLSFFDYFLRRLVVVLGLNRFIEPTLFFWGYKSC